MSNSWLEGSDVCIPSCLGLQYLVSSVSVRMSSLVLAISLSSMDDGPALSSLDIAVSVRSNSGQHRLLLHCCCSHPYVSLMQVYVGH